MCLRRSFHSAWLSLLLGMVLLPPFAGAAPAARSTSTELDQSLYIPLIRLPNPELAGRVRHNGVPAAGVQVTLWTLHLTREPVATTVTDSSGRYAFASPATTEPGQWYYVVYYNTTNSTRLYWWTTREVKDYVPGSFVHMGDFDVANIGLTSPAPGSSVSLPRTFTWNKRSASPDDHYRFFLHGASNSLAFHESTDLGWANSYQLISLHPGFSLHTPYVWTVVMYQPDGARGASFEERSVQFSGGFANSAGAAVPQWLQRASTFRVAAAAAPVAAIPGLAWLGVAEVK